jgi:hypothetical protein
MAESTAADLDVTYTVLQRLSLDGAVKTDIWSTDQFVNFELPRY